MNQPHDPNLTADLPSAPADCLRAGDPLFTTDQARDSSSTGGARPGADAPVRDVPAVPGYRVRREIARGGMGRVFAALDLGLDRDVALKILVPGANADRFVRESKITACLPHPGIPPVHALGTLADGSPFLAMKLIVGQTLAEEMKTADRPRLLQAFTQVCQAVGFAHSRGVIHRDLKPANLMVGAFGEVQVMDWGLAKDLTGREVMDEPRASEAQTVPIVGTDANQVTDHRAPGASTDDQAHAGQVLGTPAYMAPEQARGEAADARADVFALGGILCAILTGQPPFSGKSMLETIQRAGAADLAETLARLDGCGVDEELLALCRRCLSPNPVDRPANGQAVADGMTDYLHGVQERLQTAGRERAVAVARQRARDDARAAELVKSLASSDTAFVTRIVEELTPYRSQAQAALAEMLANARPDSKERLHASLALLPGDPSQVEYLRQRLLTATPAEIIVLRQALSKHAADVNPKLWTVAEDKAAAMDQRLRALAALAGLAPESERWQPLAAPLAQRLVAESPVLIGPWVEVFRPARLHLLEPLSTLCRKPLAEGEQAHLEHSLAEFQQRSVAVSLVVDYASDQPQRLADLLMDADARQFVVLWPPFAKVSDQGVPALLKELNLKLADVDGQAARERLAKRQAKAAVALLRLGKPEQVWPILKHSPDPRVRSYLIHDLSPKGAAPQTLIARLTQENDLTIQRALLLSLGEYGEQELPPDARNALLPKLQTLYRTASDPGLHAACEWLLRRWKQEAWLTQVNEDWAKDKDQREKRLEGIGTFLAKAKDKTPPQWYVNTQGQTFVVIPGPVEFTIGSPLTEKDRAGSETQHQKRIDRTFALATKAVTKEQFLRFQPKYIELVCGSAGQWMMRYPEPTCPIGGFEWHEAAAYCNWLSKHEGIPEDQWCYEIKGNAVTLKAKYLSLSGYRLPTEAEMEYATRAGALTSRYYGETDELLPKYAWYFKNSQARTWPVGSLKPNDLGLFDAQGNVYTWCQERHKEYPAGKGDGAAEDQEDQLVVTSTNSRVVRGGCFYDPASHVRSAYRDLTVPTDRDLMLGFRVARSFGNHLTGPTKPPWHAGFRTASGFSSGPENRSVEES